MRKDHFGVFYTVFHMDGTVHKRSFKLGSRMFAENICTNHRPFRIVWMKAVLKFNDCGTTVKFVRSSKKHPRSTPRIQWGGSNFNPLRLIKAMDLAIKRQNNYFDDLHEIYKQAIENKAKQNEK